jgi:hypothetical protein
VAAGAVFNDGTGNGAGHVLVFQWSGSVWEQLGSDIDAEMAEDRFGFSVALSSDGQTLAAGAYGNDGSGSSAGHVRVFGWSGSAWEQLGSDLDGEAASANFGDSVALSSGGMILAASGADYARVFQWSGAVWEQLGADLGGASVALSSDGQTLAVGASENDGAGIDAGHVRVFKWSGIAWDQLGSDVDGEAAGDGMESVALSSDGTILATGSEYNDGTGSDAGHVRVFHWSGSAWEQLGVDIDGGAAGDRFGYRVTLSSDGITLAIGALDASLVQVYQYSGSSWLQLGTDILGVTTGDRAAHVALSGDGKTLAVGASLNDGGGANAGHVRVFGKTGIRLFLIPRLVMEKFYYRGVITYAANIRPCTLLVLINMLLTSTSDLSTCIFTAACNSAAVFNTTTLSMIH